MYDLAQWWAAHRAPMAAERMESCRHAPAIAAQATALEGAPGPILCVGCGDGTELAYFPGSVGLTLNAGALLPACRRRHAVLVADMHLLPFRSGSFGGIYCKDTFEHALAPTIVLGEFFRVAREWVFLVLPDAEHWALSPLHPLILTKEQLACAALKAGWDTRHCRQQVVQHPPDSPALDWYLDCYHLTRGRVHV